MVVSSFKFGDFELDSAQFQLRREGRVLKLERIPMELLILLAEKGGSIVTRQEITERPWGKDVFVDTEHGINTAIRKIRQALRDDPERPRFVQTVTGKGYRFVAEKSSTNGSSAIAAPATEAVVPPQPPATRAEAPLPPGSRHGSHPSGCRGNPDRRQPRWNARPPIPQYPGRADPLHRRNPASQSLRRFFAGLFCRRHD